MGRYFRFPFANQGDKVVFPDTSQADGSISYNQGYGPDYQRNPVTDNQARRIERDRFNQLAFDLSSTLQLYYQESVPPFITAAENGGTAYPYAQYARVRYDSGTGDRIYESRINMNTSLPTVTANWHVVDIDGLDLRYLTQTAADARYLQGTLGQADGNIPQIGPPATTGRSAVIVDSGSNANGEYIVYSNELKIMWLGTRTLNSGNNSITLPISLINRYLDVSLTDNEGVSGARGWNRNTSTLSIVLLRVSSQDIVNAITVTGY